MILIMGFSFIMLIRNSFFIQDYLTIIEKYTLANYFNFFSRDIYVKLLTRSLFISAAATFATVGLAYPVAYFISFKIKKNKIIWLIAITLPFWMSYLLRVFCWKLVLGHNGILNSALLVIGIIQKPVEFLLHSPFAVVITLAHAWAAFAILPIFLALEKIDRTLLEAAEDLGDTPIQRFRGIVWPMSLPGVIAGSILVFIPTVGDYVTPKLVGGTKGSMIGNLIVAHFGKLNDWPMGSAMSIISMILVAIIIWIFSRLISYKKLKVGKAI
jgi:spermidine/putrescine transport system permease protein